MPVGVRLFAPGFYGAKEDDMPTALEVANYFLATAPQDTMTNLKLEKMCAYAQAVSLAYLGNPLFDESIEAWDHGPVIPTVYHEFKGNGRIPIEPRYSESYAVLPFNERQCLVLSAVNATYGVYAPWALREMSHRDFPGDFGSSKIISQEAIKEAFKQNALVLRLRSTDWAERGGDDVILSERDFWNALER